MTQKSFDVAELVAKHVTVYADRAEVKRFLKTKLSHGLNEVIVKKLSRSIDPDSIRVDGRGKAVISEVKYQEKHVKKEEEIQNNEKELNDKLTKLRDERTTVEQENQRWKKQRDVLEGVATQIGASSGNGDKKVQSGLSLISDTNFENLDKFLSYYSKRAEDVDKQLNGIQKRLEKLNEEIAVAERNLHTIRYDDNYMSREVSIMLDVAEDGEVELDVSYQLWNASWTPIYDIRVSTENKLMKISYYGMIQQSTNENWDNTKLSLSTAMPRVGGQVPELNTLKVGFKPPPQPVALAYAQHRPMRAMMKKATMEMNICDDVGFAAGAGAPEMARMERAVADVKESVISTSFDIVNPTSIPSDNTSHKVTIAILDLKPSFEYETVPSKSQFAYLKAKVINSSNYPFLPGPISVFLDNNFVAKSSIKAASPSEEFTCSLGVDPAIRVEYKSARKFHEETGILTKSSILTHEQKIDIKNTKGDPIKIVVHDHLPLSSEEKLKVHLVEPNANKIEKGIIFKINKNNNVEWEIVIPKNESREIVLKYNIEHPKGEQIEYREE